MSIFSRVFGKKPQAPTITESGKKPAPLSLVWLLREPRVIDEEEMRGRFSQVFRRPFTADMKSECCFKASKPPIFLFRFRDAALGVINAPKPYVPDPAAEAEKIREVHLKKAMLEHKAWIAVDWPGRGDVADEAKTYRLLGTVLAEFAGPDCLALYAPRLHKLNWYQPKLAAKLRGENPLSALEMDGGVVNVDGTSDEMKSAVAEAQRRWPEFVVAFGRRDGKIPFIIKAPFEDGQHREFMWVEVSEIEGAAVRGILRNHPNKLIGFREGDRVRVPAADVADWLYAENGQKHGGFTLKIVGG